MKNKIKFNVSSLTGIAVAVVTGVVATLTSISERKKEQQIDELIQKVEDLTNQKD